MAIAFPIFIFVLYGLITFGVILAQKQQITNAAADGARAAVGATDPVGAATARVQQSLGSPGNYTATYTTGTCSGGSGNCITVNIVYDYANHPLVPPAPGLGLVTPNTFHSSAVVQYS
jgi:Flp pilus assembly protein TadG